MRRAGQPHAQCTTLPDCGGCTGKVKARTRCWSSKKLCVSATAAAYLRTATTRPAAITVGHRVARPAGFTRHGWSLTAAPTPGQVWVWRRAELNTFCSRPRPPTGDTAIRPMSLSVRTRYSTHAANNYALAMLCIRLAPHTPSDLYAFFDPLLARPPMDEHTAWRGCDSTCRRPRRLWWWL